MGPDNVKLQFRSGEVEKKGEEAQSPKGLCSAPRGTNTPKPGCLNSLAGLDSRAF